MEAEPMAVEGAFTFTAPIHHDDRGSFSSPYLASSFAEATGKDLFSPAQMSHSTSRRGVVRGIHYTAAPPGAAKLVYCPRGRALDFVIDLRTGSPSFGRWTRQELGPAAGRSVYLPVGTGHLFVALEDDTVMVYAMSREYVPENELAVAPHDPDLALALPEGADVLSQRDTAAPTLRTARARGLLPDYRTSVELERAQVRRPVSPSGHR
ncbi:dTDP-4-dehydrorhamnose 3,5-epimerase [Nocardiopsis kunsanensis]|uniref:dTDP-4-dehydrorhamnose 3,5-epimerase n=1 Tax=Nocardiopsis kunsanensis TaxID=141693 RepID=A0A918X915_9ACTN|nr:dTDP-4-dehydrorhamnose 3,5-epimerase family protein [Nocardiopsis kunsanensis]GHD17639.1 dTDP-4-dehydrorhamnose 3,5-epimerase [Nocardiopsis kunsanensis]